MTLTVRLLEAADWPAYRDIRLRALKDTPKAFSESHDEALALEPADWQSRLAADEVFGLFSGSAIAGMAVLIRYKSAATAHRAWIGGVFVDPALRGQGAGAKLLDAVIEKARTTGLLQLHLGVGDFNTGAQRLYESRGFSRYGTQPRGVYAESEYVDEHLLVKFLDKEETNE